MNRTILTDLLYSNIRKFSHFRLEMQYVYANFLTAALIFHFLIHSLLKSITFILPASNNISALSMTVIRTVFDFISSCKGQICHHINIFRMAMPVPGLRNSRTHSYPAIAKQIPNSK